jgi:hypothetical protein
MKLKKLGLMILLGLLTTIVLGCSAQSDKNTLVSLNIESIDRMDVANGTTGDFVLLEDTTTYMETLKWIKENRYITHKNEEVGWVIGVRIYSKGKHYWFMPRGVGNYNYENPDFFKVLLAIVSREKQIDFVDDYIMGGGPY